MANQMRWRYGETNPIVVPVASETTVEIGDLLYLSSGTAIPATDVATGETAAATQTTFSAGFLGIAMQQSVSGDETPIRVATTRYFEMGASNATYAIGDKVGLYAATNGSVSSSQKVAKVTSATYGIGRIARTETVATTSALIAIRSVVMNGSFA